MDAGDVGGDAGGALRAGLQGPGNGAVEGISTILSVQNDIIPPTINHFTDDPEIDSKLNFTFDKAQERVVNYGLTNTFGFGGHNASLIFKKFVK